MIKLVSAWLPPNFTLTRELIEKYSNCYKIRKRVKFVHILLFFVSLPKQRNQLIFDISGSRRIVLLLEGIDIVGSFFGVALFAFYFQYFKFFSPNFQIKCSLIFRAPRGLSIQKARPGRTLFLHNAFFCWFIPSLILTW